MFHACSMLFWIWKAGKNLKGRISLSKNLIGSGYRKQTILIILIFSERSFSCMFYVDLELEGGKKLKRRDFFE